MEMTNTLTRRAALGAIASLPAVGGATAALAVPAEPSPILALFREWAAMFDEAANSDGNESQSARLDICYDLEKRMAALPSTSAADMAAKLIAFTSYGEWGLDEDGTLIAEARSLV